MYLNDLRVLYMFPYLPVGMVTLGPLSEAALWQFLASLQTCMQICHELCHHIQRCRSLLGNPEYRGLLIPSSSLWGGAPISLSLPPSTLWCWVRKHTEKMAKSAQDSNPGKRILTCWIHRRVFQSPFASGALRNVHFWDPCSSFWPISFDFWVLCLKDVKFHSVNGMGKILKLYLDTSPQHHEFCKVLCSARKSFLLCLPSWCLLVLYSSTQMPPYPFNRPLPYSKRPPPTPCLMCFPMNSHGCTSTVGWWRGKALAQHTWSKSQSVTDIPVTLDKLPYWSVSFRFFVCKRGIIMHDCDSLSETFGVICILKFKFLWGMGWGIVFFRKVVQWKHWLCNTLSRVWDNTLKSNT